MSSNALDTTITARVARQEAIITRDVPTLRPETMLKSVMCLDNDYKITIRYIPDRTILIDTGIADYYNTLPWSILEDAYDAAYAILDDLNNQLVPKWVQVIVQKGAQSALVEDRQPHWNNPSLLSRQVIY